MEEAGNITGATEVWHRLFIRALRLPGVHLQQGWYRVYLAWRDRTWPGNQHKGTVKTRARVYLVISTVRFQYLDLHQPKYDKTQ